MNTLTRMDKATLDNRSRQLNPRDRTYHLGRDDKRANLLNPNNEAYWHSRGEPPAVGEGGSGWSSLLTAVGVVAAGLAVLAVAASVPSGSDDGVEAETGHGGKVDPGLDDTEGA